jgi:subtilisin family serine protease
MAIVTTSKTIKTLTGTVIDIFQNNVKVIESVYDKTGHLQTVANYTQTGALKDTSTYVYNSRGLVDKKTVTDASGKITDIWSYSYNTKNQIDHINHLNGQVDFYINGIFDHSNTTKPAQPFTGWDSIFGHGEIDCMRAFKLAGVTLNPVISSVKTDWNISSEHFDSAWAAGYTGKGIVIADIDSGVDLNNAQLTQHLSKWNWNFVDNNSNVQDQCGHGSFTASLINAARDSDLVTGAAYDAELMVLKVANAAGIATIDAAATAIYYAVDHGADIINLSMNSILAQPKLETALQYCNAHDVLVSISAGNNLGNAPQCPANYAKTNDNVVAVGATMQIANKLDNFAAFSNKAGTVQEFNYVDAAGVAVSGFNSTGKMVTMNGTSMAAPMVASEMALMKQYLEETHNFANAVIDEMVMDYVCHGTNNIGLVGIQPLVLG